MNVVIESAEFAKQMQRFGDRGEGMWLDRDAPLVKADGSRRTSQCGENSF